jgi:hypothetical protein
MPQSTVGKHSIQTHTQRELLELFRTAADFTGMRSEFLKHAGSEFVVALVAIAPGSGAAVPARRAISACARILRGNDLLFLLLFCARGFDHVAFKLLADSRLGGSLFSTPKHGDRLRTGSIGKMIFGSERHHGE